QVVVIFAGVNGYLDKVDVSQVGDFEQKFLGLVRDKHADVLNTIRDEAKVSDENDAKLRSILDDFLKNFA
ncbi:unnamed protein product, partial [Ectocarpus sp. 12 AP-2014]